MAAYFCFQQTTPNGDLATFVFALNDLQKIEFARKIVIGMETARVHVQGTIVRGTVSYNPQWSFHLNPDSIDFFENQIELCDANVTYVETHLDEVGGSTLPRGFWCPWSSRVVGEVTPPPGIGAGPSGS